MIKLNFQRQEFKYLLNLDQYLQVRSHLIKRGLTPDIYSKKSSDNSYYVASLYLDTLDYQAYWEKQYGIHTRTKYRLRTYVQTSLKNTPIFWELKRKFGDFQKKNRFQLSWQKTHSMLTSSASLDLLQSGLPYQELLTKYYLSWLRKNLQPSVLISYQREPFIDFFYPNFRLTFDYQIQAMATNDLFSKSRQTQVLPDKVIMEIKFTGLVPAYISHLNQYFDFYRQSLSKYCLALEACDIVTEENR